MDRAPLSSSAPTQRKGLSIESSENIPANTKENFVASFPTELNSSTDDTVEPYAQFTSGERGGVVAVDDDFGDFASTVSEKSLPPTKTETGEDDSDEFGAFQGDKPKFGKFDFLKASAQTKVKSSEEMIKSELATFDLSVKGKLHSQSKRKIDIYVYLYMYIHMCECVSIYITKPCDLSVLYVYSINLWRLIISFFKVKELYLTLSCTSKKHNIT